MLNEVNAIACLVIAVRVLAYKRRGAAHNLLGALFAYALIVACGSVTIRIMTGDYAHSDWSEIFINITVGIAVIAARGNIMRLIRFSRITRRRKL